jgi:heme oxygenase (biliverdin-IX-beta and delta-forming)
VSESGFTDFISNFVAIPMLSQNLKKETIFNHQQLEKKLVSKMREMQNVDDYTSLLQVFYSYFGGVETLVNSHIDIKQLPDYAQRRKTQQLVSDLTALDANVPLAADAEYLPIITNNAQALGAMYVMEGSTLGGQIIKKMIHKQLGIEADGAISFFNGYGDHTVKMWDTFKDVLDRTETQETKDIIIATANETFQKFSEWFDVHYSD